MREIIDMHCDTILKCMLQNKLLDEPAAHINIEKLKKGGCLAQCFALWLPTNDQARKLGVDDRDKWALYKRMLAVYKENISLFNDELKPALSTADIAGNSAEGKMSAVLTVEDGVCVEGKMERLDEMFKDGVRMLALTWNYENCFGFPNSSEAAAHKKGLKPFGIDAVRHMNGLGIIIDVSHLSEGGFYDVAKYSEKPFVASHSCCKALCGHSRNLTDAQLHKLADKGGIVGLNFLSEFLSEGSGFTKVEDVVRHFAHLRDCCGVESIALGSDFDGIECGLEFKDYSGYPTIIDALTGSGGLFTDDEIEKITHRNFLRVMKDNE